jgi:hypothetical protein
MMAKSKATVHTILPGAPWSGGKRGGGAPTGVNPIQQTPNILEGRKSRFYSGLGKEESVKDKKG